jgi:hypothetical protein
MADTISNHIAHKGGRVSQRPIQRIRDTITGGEYDLTRHAIDEMAEDYLRRVGPVLTGYEVIAQKRNQSFDWLRSGKGTPYS